MNDIGGRKVPMEQAFENEECFITAELNRFSWTAMRFLRNRVTGVAGTNGVFTTTSIGSLMLTEGWANTLYLIYPYALAKPFNQNAVNGALPAGYALPGAIFEGPDVEEGGTEEQQQIVQFRCLPYFNLPSNPLAFTLYTQLAAPPSGLPPIT